MFIQENKIKDTQIKFHDLNITKFLYLLLKLQLWLYRHDALNLHCQTHVAFYF